MNEKNTQTTFSYDELRDVFENKKTPFHHNEEASVIANISDNKCFYELHCISTKEKYDKKINEGWKFHVSLGTDENNIKKAWDIIKDIVIEENLGAIKVVRSGKEMTGDQQGKEITIYTWVNVNKTPENWVDIMSKVTTKLHENRIRPGPPAISHAHKQEHSFDRNPFVSYRYQHEGESSTEIVDLGKQQETQNPYQDVDLSIMACIKRVASPKMDAAPELPALEAPGGKKN